MESSFAAFIVDYRCAYLKVRTDPALLLKVFFTSQYFHFYMHITSATICCVLCLIKVKRRLDRAQRRAAKIVLKTKDSDLKWLPLSMRRDMHTINLTFKCLKGSPPMFFKDYFKVFRTIHNTRGSGHNLLLPKVRTETARKFFILMDLNFLIIFQVKWRILSQLRFLKLVFWNYIYKYLFYVIYIFIYVFFILLYIYIYFFYQDPHWQQHFMLKR